MPKFTPTIVNTSYVANGFIDAFEATNDDSYLLTARSSCDFIMKDLHHSYENDTVCFSYTPIDQLKVHNANILGAALLARVYSRTKENQLSDLARQSIDYVLRYQKDDGSWSYAETDIQQWIDSFHTGFVLESLHRYITSTGDTRHLPGLKSGFNFFIRHFFLDDGTPKYYNNSTYPVDIHSAAQGIVTLTKLKPINPDADFHLQNLLEWTINNMQSPEGFFYFQKHRHYTNKISYMRWSQSWMYYALATYLYYDNGEQI